MAARFELVLDTAGKFYFHLRGPDGRALLTSHAFDSKIMAQSAVMHARSAIKEATRIVQQENKDGTHHLTVIDNDGSILARSPKVANTSELTPVRDGICGACPVAPIIDLTKRPTATTTT